MASRKRAREPAAKPNAEAVNACLTLTGDAPQHIPPPPPFQPPSPPLGVTTLAAAGVPPPVEQSASLQELDSLYQAAKDDPELRHRIIDGVPKSEESEMLKDEVSAGAAAAATVDEVKLDHTALGVDEAALDFVLLQLSNAKPHPSSSLSDVCGQPEAVRRTRLQVEAIRNPKRFKACKPSAGLLFAGPPGTGKTMLARAMAKEAGCTVLEFTKSDLFRKSKPSLERLNALFAVARARAPSIIFLDEIDGVASSTHTGMVNVMKTLLETRDAAHAGDPVVILVGATNSPDKLDKAILDRMGEPIVFRALDAEARRHILQREVNCKGGGAVELSSADWDTVVPLTAGFSGRRLADIATDVAQTVASESVQQELTDNRPIVVGDLLCKLPPAPQTVEPGAASDDALPLAATGAEQPVAKRRRSSASSADPELGKLLERLFKPEAGNKMARKLVCELLEDADDNEAWQRLPAHEAAAKGQCAPRAYEALTVVLKAEPFNLENPIYQETDRVLTGGSQKAWFVEGIAVKS